MLRRTCSFWLSDIRRGDRVFKSQSVVPCRGQRYPPPVVLVDDESSADPSELLLAVGLVASLRVLVRRVRQEVLRSNFLAAKVTLRDLVLHAGVPNGRLEPRLALANVAVSRLFERVPVMFLVDADDPEFSIRIQDVLEPISRQVMDLWMLKCSSFRNSWASRSSCGGGRLSQENDAYVPR